MWCYVQERGFLFECWNDDVAGGWQEVVELNGWIAAAAGYQRIWGTPHAHYSAPKPFSAPQTFLQTKPRSYLGHIEPVAEQKIGPNLDLAAASA